MQMAEPRDQVLRGSSPALNLGAWAVGAALVLLVATRIVMLFDGRDFVLDEWMLLLAIQAEAHIGPSTALGLFEQTAPYGVATLFKGLIGAFGLHPAPLRTLVFAVDLAGLFLVWRTARGYLGAVGIVAALLIAGLTTDAIQYALGAKQYAFEFAAAAAILWAACRMTAEALSTRSLLVFGIISLASLPFANTAPFATAACAVGAAAEVLARGARPWRGLVIALGFGILYLAAAVAWYLLALKPATAFQFAGYANIYSDGYLALSGHGVAKFFKTFELLLGFPLSRLRSLAVIGLIAVGISGLALAIVARRPGAVLAAVAAGVLMVAIGGLSAAHILPVVYSRHFIFALPLFGLSLGLGIDTWGVWLGERMARAPALVRTAPACGLALAAVVVGGFSLRDAAHQKLEETTPVLAKGLRACPVVLAYYGALPAATAYRQSHPDLRLIGAVPYATSAHGWLWQVRDDYDAYVRGALRAAGPYPTLCLLSAHGRGDEPARLLAALGRTRTCHVVAQAIGAELNLCQTRGPSPDAEPPHAG